MDFAIYVGSCAELLFGLDKRRIFWGTNPGFGHLPFGAKKFDCVGLIADSDLSSFFLIQLVEAITG